MLPVAVIEENETDRENACLLLNAAGLDVSGFEAATAYLSNSLFSQTHISVISLDMSGCTGLDIVRLVKETSGAIAVFGTLTSPNTSLTVEAMLLDCASVMEKPITIGEIVDACKGQAKPPQNARKKRQLKEVKLTTREQEVLQAILADKTNKQIAVQMKVAVRTVESHRSKLYRKLDVGSHAELVRKWQI